MITEYLSLSWEGLAPALTNHLWQSTLFLLVTALLALALRKNHARTRYWLWLAASIKFLIPFSLLVALGSHLTAPQHSAPTPASFYFATAVDQFSQPFTPRALTLAIPVTSPTAESLNLTRLLPVLLVAIWFAGFAVVLSFWWVYWRRISKAMRDAVPIHEGRELELLRRLERIGGMKAQIRMLLSPTSMEPGIFGVARPVLIWPQGISQRLNDAHLEAILAHEVCHARRRDNLTAAVHMMAQAIFWFHPLVWWLGTCLLEERERACDEEVMRLCKQPQVYVESILKVCEFCLESPLPCVSGVTGSDLKQRVVNILAEQVTLKLDFSRKLLLAIVGLMAVTMPIMFGQVMAAQRLSDVALGLAPQKDVALEAQSSTGQTSGAPTFAMPQSQTAAGGKLAFEVASIHPTKPGEFTSPNFPISNDNSFTSTPTDSFIADFSLRTYIEFAYKIRLTRAQEVAMLAKVPGWVDTDAYEIRAKAEGNATKDQMRLMMQSLLADRFKLAIHFETKEVPVFALVLIKPGQVGPKLNPHADGARCDAPGQTVLYRCDGYSFRETPNHRYMEGSRNTTTSLLAASLGSIPGVMLDRPVVDQTGLSGAYDFTLEWTPQSNRTAAADESLQPDAPGPTFQDDLKDQLGMKLVPTKAPLEILVIDHVERPSEN